MRILGYNLKKLNRKAKMYIKSYYVHKQFLCLTEMDNFLNPIRRYVHNMM